jgi:hypothetical protein
MIVDKVIRNKEAIVTTGRAWLTQQSHPSFIWRASSFAPIAWNAGANHILPTMFPTASPWDNMV